MKKWVIAILVILVIVLVSVNLNKEKDTSDIKIGWMSDLTGANAKYGAIEAGRLAVEEINNAGGINGRKIVLVEENSLCDATAALSAVRKLIDVDKVKYILGGHCSTESLAVAPIAEKNKVILLASITTSPAYSEAGDYIFRTSSISTQQADLISDYAINNNFKKVAIVYENKDYPRPIAEALKKNLEQKGGTVVLFEGYPTEENDFRSILSKVKESGAEAIFISPQSPDKAAMLLKQIKELRLGIKVFGNEQVGSSATMAISGNDAAEGAVFAEPSFNVSDPKTKEFIDAYNKKYGTNGIPYGIYTSESYDAVYMLADAIRETGGSVEKVKDYLYGVKDYLGASGYITINEKGDGVRKYVLKTVSNGKSVTMTISY